MKEWLNRSVRATRERLHSGHCFRAAGEKNSAVRWSRDLQPVAIQLELFREPRVLFEIFKAVMAPSLATDFENKICTKLKICMKTKSFVCRRWIVESARHPVGINQSMKHER